MIDYDLLLKKMHPKVEEIMSLKFPIHHVYFSVGKNSEEFMAIDDKIRKGNHLVFLNKYISSKIPYEPKHSSQYKHTAALYHGSLNHILFNQNLLQPLRQDILESYIAHELVHVAVDLRFPKLRKSDTKIHDLMKLEGDTLDGEKLEHLTKQLKISRMLCEGDAYAIQERFIEKDTLWKRFVAWRQVGYLPDEIQKARCIIRDHWKEYGREEVNALYEKPLSELADFFEEDSY